MVRGARTARGGRCCRQPRSCHRRPDPERRRADPAERSAPDRNWRRHRGRPRCPASPPARPARRSRYRLQEGVMSEIPSAVVVERLSKSFGHGDLAVHAVRDVELRVVGGEVVLIMGPSGSGKTTLLLMLGAMLRPTSGSVVIDGTDLATAPERELPTLRARHT